VIVTTDGDPAKAARDRRTPVRLTVLGIVERRSFLA